MTNRQIEEMKRRFAPVIIVVWLTFAVCIFAWLIAALYGSPLPF